MKKQYKINGMRFSDDSGFVIEFRECVLGGYPWNGNLNSLNDILRGGFGTPDNGFRIIWMNHRESMVKLGYDEKVKLMETHLKTCHNDHIGAISKMIEDAKYRRGSTLYDDIVEIIHIHCVGGEEEGDGIELELA